MPSPKDTMPNLLGELAAPTCSKREHHWDRCGAYYVEPIDSAHPRGSVA